ncbi:Asp-tRNA(Asn)/Glu-tRNA(Gln) amidotransferase subunit GatB, partial [Candidatus Dependentiae bacterium]|nr:Asp-tRNA(Asn)/Glu-tRNA(Gln) amidotransferase subunit GatB [Candidatus Dependentiae bacterium]
LEDGTEKSIRLTRIHMEEDAGKNIHVSDTNESFVDLNRAGTPLLEMVSYPDISSSYEARKYLEELRLTVIYLGICSGNMEEGAFRADTNISVRKKGQKELGTKCELKNINSFKFISDAIEYETKRQIDLLESGQKVQQETRLWNSKKGETETMRIKEEAADYRYFDDPDLPLIVVLDEEIARVKESMPELPSEKYHRFIQGGLTPYEAEVLIQDLDIALFYEKAHALNPSKQLINWILRDLMGSLKATKTPVKESLITPSHVAHLLELIEQGAINNRGAQEIFAEMAATGKEPRAIMVEKGLEQMDNSAELEGIIAQILAENPESVALYKAGRDKLWGFFVGQAMQKTKGKGNPQTINELLKKLLQ